MRRVRRFLALVTALVASREAHAQFDTLNLTPALTRAMDSLAMDAVAAFCAPVFRRSTRNVWVDSLVPASRASNPDCSPREATVLVRPMCYFTAGEFLELRVRALYVLIICRPSGVGIPLGILPRPDRIAPTHNSEVVPVRPSHNSKRTLVPAVSRATG